MASTNFLCSLPGHYLISAAMKRLAIFIILVIAVAGCAKDKLSVGRGDPEDEFRNCINLSSKGKYEDSIQCMEMFKARYPKTAMGQDAELRIGDAQFGKKEHLLAAESYNAFIRLYPANPKCDYAHYRAGVAYFKESPKAIDRDQQYLDSAIEHLRTVLRRYPNSQYAELSAATLRVALGRIARRQFYIGRFYFKTGEYIAAIPRLKEVAENYPNSGLADRALGMIVEADIKLGELAGAKDAFSELSMKYPKSDFTKKAERRLLAAAKKRG